MPQLADIEAVEVLICDNCSTDDTPKTIALYSEKYRGIRSLRNLENLGFDGNFVVALRNARGRYMALLSDDDYYLPGAVKEILNCLEGGEYGLVAVNYSVRNDAGREVAIFAPTDSIKFKVGYDLWDYPSVSHYSGLIYNRALGLSALSIYEAKQLSDPYYTKTNRRGVFVEVAVIALAVGSLPAIFLGSRLVGVRVPPADDLNAVPADERKIYEVVIDYIRIYRRLSSLGFYPIERIAYRERVALKSLSSVARHVWPSLSNSKRNKMRAELDLEFGHIMEYKLLQKNVLRCVEWRCCVNLLRALVWCARKFKAVSGG